MDTVCHMLNCRKKYNIKSNHIVILQLHSIIPNSWTKTLKQNTYSTPLTHIQNSIHINKSKFNVEKSHIKIIIGT